MPPRVIVSIEEGVLRFGAKPLFDDIRLHVAEGDRICLLGRNGAGKTTLMRLLAGELELDLGRRFALPGIRTGYLAQKPVFAPGQHVREYVLSGLEPQERGEESHHLADKVLAPLDLDPHAVMGTLSGGQARRASLAQALIRAPDLLLLDEPTNHLDLSGIEWLESYLQGYRGAVVCVSHDRAFLANVSRKVFWIDRGRIRVCPEGYAKFDAWAEQVIAQEARELQNLHKKLEAEEDWMHGGVSGRRKRNQRRLRELHALRARLKTDKAAFRQRSASIALDALEAPPASKIAAEFKHVSKSFGDKPILKDFCLRIMRGDRIGILGRNGSGKSTFLKLLTAELEPDSGRVTRGKTVDITYFDQNRIELQPHKTLWETLCPDGGSYIMLGTKEKPRPRHVCGYLKDFLFDPKLARDRVSTLSGGQQNRLLLAKVLAHPGNVLILDEPTNDLDMDTLDMLQEILADYPGTLIVVSHDRDFLDRTVTEVLAFEGDAKVELSIGGYTDYLERKQGKISVAPKVASVEPEMKPSALKTAAGKMPYKLKFELEQLPGKIAKLEEEIAVLKEKFMDANFYTRAPREFDAASQRLTEAEAELEAVEMRWLELEEWRG